MMREKEKSKSRSEIERITKKKERKIG